MLTRDYKEYVKERKSVFVQINEVVGDAILGIDHTMRYVIVPAIYDGSTDTWNEEDYYIAAFDDLNDAKAYINLCYKGVFIRQGTYGMIDGFLIWDNEKEEYVD